MMGKILMIDNYDSFTFNLVQIIEQVSGVSVEVHRNDKISLSDVEAFDKIVLSPGPGLPCEAGIMSDVVKRYSDTKNILGVCLGHQCIAEVFGGTLINLPVPKHGKVSQITVLDEKEILFQGLPHTCPVGRYHSWAVNKEDFPSELLVTAMSEDGVIMALRHREYRVRGVQFHPESILTPVGAVMLKNWISEE